MLLGRSVPDLSGLYRRQRKKRAAKAGRRHISCYETGTPDERVGAGSAHRPANGVRLISRTRAWCMAHDTSHPAWWQRGGIYWFLLIPQPAKKVQPSDEHHVPQIMVADSIQMKISALATTPTPGKAARRPSHCCRRAASGCAGSPDRSGWRSADTSAR